MITAMGRVVKRRAPHLRLAEGPKLPMTLDEYAGSTDVDAELRQKLGNHSFWLAASQMYGIFESGDTTGDYLSVMDDTAVPVSYRGLRTLTSIEVMHRIDREKGIFPDPGEPVAVFKVNIPTDLEPEEILSSGHVASYYSEVAVRLGQKVSVLELHEHQSRATKQRQERPQLRIVHG